MAERHRWTGRIYRIVEEAFNYGWHEHLQSLNTQYGLGSRHRLATHGPGEPPTFFNGDIDALQPDRWTLVISLNPHQVSQVDTTEEPKPARHFATPTEYWDFWRRYNTCTWYPGFYRPLVRVAVGALGEELSRACEPEYATEQMLFLELCPYASPKFNLQPQQVAALVAGDYGFGVARRILRVATEEGRPALILVNGNAAITAVEAIEEAPVTWSEKCYTSHFKVDKPLHHWQGQYRTAHGAVPIAGFPFLRTMKGHNSYAEIAQLGDALDAFITGSPAGTK